MNVVNAQFVEVLKLLDDEFGRAQAHRVLVGHMLDAVLAARRAAAAGDDEGERPLDHRHALLVEGQHLMARDGQVIQAGNEWAIGVDDDLPRFACCPLARLAPCQPANPGQG